MKNLFFIFLIVFTTSVYGQEAMAPPKSFSKNEKLSLDAYKIIKANKFLNFATVDTLKEVVDGKVINVSSG